MEIKGYVPTKHRLSISFRERLKRLIRNKLTGEYLKPDGTWTGETTLARAFPDTRSVVEAELKYGLYDVELVLLMEDQPGRDLVIPLGKSTR